LTRNCASVSFVCGHSYSPFVMFNRILWSLSAPEYISLPYNNAERPTVCTAYYSAIPQTNSHPENYLFRRFIMVYHSAPL
jgi:hypothetical protein